LTYSVPAVVLIKGCLTCIKLLVPSWYISKLSSPVPNLNLALSIKSIPPDVLFTSIFVPPVLLPIASISDNVSTVSTCESTYAFICACVDKPLPLFDTAPVTIASEGIGPVPFVIVNWFDVVVWTAVRSPNESPCIDLIA
jgi:hypothetical protein